MANSIPASDVKTIIFACEAGIGSSLMGVNSLKKKLKKAKIDVQVIHKPVRAVPSDAQVVIAHKGLAAMARQQAPDAVLIAFTHFLNDPELDKVVKSLQAGKDLEGNA